MELPRPKYLNEYTPPDYLLDHIRLEFILEEAYTTVTSTQRLRRNVGAPGASPLILDGRELELLSISMDGHPLRPEDFHTDMDTLRIDRVPSSFTLEVVTRLYPQNNTSLEGLYCSNGVFCTQCEAEGFRKITYAMDRPDVMAKYSCRIVADKNTYPVLLSNGNLVKTGELNGQRHFTEWDDPFKKPGYLFALVAGDLACVTDQFRTCSGREVALKIYTEPENADKCGHALRSLKKAMAWDEAVYGREYDLDIYMIVAVNHFNMGAMENKGLNVFNAKYVLAKPETATDTDYINIETVIAHEYFHNWTGNRVTLKNWFQLSLKEGLTVFRDQEFSADMASRAVRRISDVKKLRQFQFPEDAGPMAHPVRPDSYIQMNNFYTQTVYSKGAEIIRMIHQLIGPALFRKGMDLYFERFDGQAVTTDDFIHTMEDAGEIDLSQFRLWYAQAGTPEITIAETYTPEDRSFSLTFQQISPPTPGQPEKKPLHIPVAIGLLDSMGKDLPLQLEGEPAPVGTTRVISLRENKQSFRFVNIPEKPTPSLFRSFSAPVKLKPAYSDDTLVFLFQNDSDPFNRWDAGQQLMTRMMMGLVQDAKNNRPLALNPMLFDAFRATLKNTTLDKALIAQTLTPPSESELGDKLADMGQKIDPDVIHNVLLFTVETLSRELIDDLLRVFEENQDNEFYRIDPLSMARRSLKNIALAYLSRCNSKTITNRILSQFQNATNMTDEISALGILADMDRLESGEAITQFYEKWRSDSLVLEKWFAVQASSKLPGTLERVKKLTHHPDFSLKIPNKVRSLIGVFCSSNPWNFHHASGNGYQFLADQVIALNKINPQMSAKMVDFFAHWKKYEDRRQHLMKSQLQRIMDSGDLSDNVYEMVSKALGG